MNNAAVRWTGYIRKSKTGGSQRMNESYIYIYIYDQPRGIVVRVSAYKS